MKQGKKFNVFLICMIPVPLIGFIFLLIGLRSFFIKLNKGEKKC